MIQGGAGSTLAPSDPVLPRPSPQSAANQTPHLNPSMTRWRRPSSVVRPTRESFATRRHVGPGFARYKAQPGRNSVGPRPTWRGRWERSSGPLPANHGGNSPSGNAFTSRARTGFTGQARRSAGGSRRADGTDWFSPRHARPRPSPACSRNSGNGAHLRQFATKRECRRQPSPEENGQSRTIVAERSDCTLSTTLACLIFRQHGGKRDQSEDEISFRSARSWL